MSQNLYAQFTGVPMSDDDIDDLLESEGYGILAVCDDGRPYSVPVSFGYDGESVYVPFLVTGDGGTKTEIVEEGTAARLLATDIRGRFDWRSVSVTGPVRSVDPDGEEWDVFLDALVDNGWFMRAFERAGSVDSIRGWRLDPEEVTGLERVENTPD